MADVIYKFLSVEYAFKVMEDKQLKVSLLSELNDIFDCRPNLPFTADPSRPESSWLAEIRESISQRTGLLCFSEGYQSPLLWGHYADGAKGLALGFDPGFFKSQERITVKYTKSRSEPILLKGTPLNEAFFLKLKRGFFGTKAKEWKYEREVRYLVNLEECVPRTRMYFTEFDGHALREVIVGPGCPARPAYLRNFLATHYKGIGVSLHTADLHPELFEVAIRRFPPDEPFVS